MENMHTDVRLYSVAGSLSCTSRKATSVKKEESSKAKKNRRPISLDSGKEMMCTYWGALYFLCEGWLGDFIFMGIMISNFFLSFFVFVSWTGIKDDKIFPCPCEQFFLYLNITCEWRIKWIKCDWQTILFKIDKFLGYLKEPNL